MKKILLVKPKDSRVYAVIPNLGLGYLASSLRKNNYDVSLLDCNKYKDSEEIFKDYLKNYKFHAIGFQIYTNGLMNAKEMISEALNISPETIIIVGGPHPSGDPADTFRTLPGIDCAVIGEGEKAIVELMGLNKSDFRKQDILRSVKNLAFRNDDDEVLVNEVDIFDNLDDIDMPAWDLIDPTSYPISPHGTFTRTFPVAPIMTSRGCPYLCTFCASFKIFGRKVRQRSAKNVLDEITYLYNEYKVREFHIEDDNFTIRKDYVMEVANGIINRNLKIWWACPNGIRADTIDEEMLKKMEESGCYSFAFGIESGSSKILKDMKKKVALDKIENKVALVKDKTNINVTGFFLIGYPGETEEDIIKTIEFSKRLRLDKASFSPAMPLPGSEIYSDWKIKMGAEPIDWNRFLYYQIVPHVSDLETKVLKKYLKKAITGFYLRPRIIFGLFSEIKTLYQLNILIKRAKTIIFK